jgi:hypothetical protein
MRPPIYDVYQMKADRLPEGTKAVWLRTWPDEKPAFDDWTFVGREHHPSKWTIAEMNENGFCFREIPSWLDSSKGHGKAAAGLRLSGGSYALLSRGVGYRD